MQKPNLKKNLSNNQRDQNRLTTAPVRQRPKYSDLYKTSNFELPVIRGKNTIGREPMVASRDIKRNTARKQQPIKIQHNNDHHQHKRPQTSKGSRNCSKHQSQYYEDDGDDLIVTSMHQRIQNFKKINQNNHFQHPTRTKNL